MSKNNILQGAFILTASSILIRLLGFIYRILLSRSLGPEGMGVLQLAMPVLFTSLALISAGIPLAVSRLVAQRMVVQDLYGVRRILYTALALVISSSMLICIVLILNVNWISYSILKEPRVRGALLALYPAIIMMSISSVFKGYFYGVKNFYPPAISEIIEEVITIALALYLLRIVGHLDIALQVTAVALAIVIGELSSLLYLNYSYHRSMKNRYRSSKNSSYPFPFVDIIKISGPVTLIRLISSISTSLGSILIPQRLIKSGTTHSQAMSYLGILNGMVLPLLFIPFTFVGSLAVVMIPNLSEDLALNNRDRIRSKISKAILVTVVASLPFGAIMTALAHPIGILLYNQEEVGPMLELMAYLSSITALSHTLSAILNGLGKQNKSAIYAFLGEVIDMICIFYLVALPNLRINGYIIGFLLSSLTVLLLQFITVYRVTSLSIMWNEWLFKPILAALLTTSITRLLYLWLSASGYSLPLSFLVSALTGTIVYLSSLYVMGSISFIRKLVYPARQT